MADAVWEDDKLRSFGQTPIEHEERGPVVKGCPKKKGVSYAVAGSRETVLTFEWKKTLGWRVSDRRVCKLQ